jgi:hypothetical protein
MNDALLVCGIERLGDLAGDVERTRDRQRPMLETMRECRAFDQFEHQRGDAIRFFESVDCANVRMIERGEQARFASEATAPLGIGYEVPQPASRRKRADAESYCSNDSISCPSASSPAHTSFKKTSRSSSVRASAA